MSPSRKSPNKAPATKAKPKTPPRPRTPKGGGKAEVEGRAAAPPSPARTTTGPLYRVDFPVRWRDLDAFNHVNNATFLTYLEEARLCWLQSLSGPWLTESSAPVLASAEIQFRRPVVWPETLRVELDVRRVGNSSLTLGHRVLSATREDVLYCEGSTVMVWVDATSGKAASLPDAVRAACTRAEG
ncbi:MAG: hypothetical protein KatS3mg126_1367 [Lysobacteraceae bacterium]|nr:MAG: hypothetical protein KatS3mg126_1367 [Xanthomonadaceae bacterium]